MTALLPPDGPAPGARSWHLVAGANRLAPSTGRECRAPRTGAGTWPPNLQDAPRQRLLRPRTPRRSSELRHAIRPRNGRRTSRQVCWHVREQMDLGVRRKGQAGRKRADQTRHQSRTAAGPTYCRISKRRIALRFFSRPLALDHFCPGAQTLHGLALTLSRESLSVFSL